MLLIPSLIDLYHCDNAVPGMRTKATNLINQIIINTYKTIDNYLGVICFANPGSLSGTVV